jgi:hypothetical protein
LRKRLSDNDVPVHHEKQGVFDRRERADAELAALLRALQEEPATAALRTSGDAELRKQG